MAANRLWYLTGLLASVVLYVANGAWVTAYILCAVLALPWFSLVVSLPAMAKFSLRISGDLRLCQGEQGQLWLTGGGSLPLPTFQGSIRLRNVYSGAAFFYNRDAGIPAQHCGGLLCSIERCKMYDYLGLWSFPIKNKEPVWVRIFPRAVVISSLPPLEQADFPHLGPRPAGGFSEQQEYRPYRPGDSLSQVHWKLSAKTGGWILREPQEPQPGSVAVYLCLSGDSPCLDRKLGQLLWLGQWLLAQGQSFLLYTRTAAGLHSGMITGEDVLEDAIGHLLTEPPAAEDVPWAGKKSGWLWQIGGECHES